MLGLLVSEDTEIVEAGCNDAEHPQDSDQGEYERFVTDHRGQSLEQIGVMIQLSLQDTDAGHQEQDGVRRGHDPQPPHPPNQP